MWNQNIILSGLILVIILSACQSDLPQMQLLDTPSKMGGASDLHIGEDGKAYLSWIEYVDDTTDVLQYSILEGQYWSSPVEITRGSDWFVNWADFPTLATQKKGQQLAVHWLEKSAQGTYDYDVHIIQSQDGGLTWGGEFIVHRDSLAAEHGFVSLLPMPNGRFFATWLDGRNTKKDGNNTNHGHGGAMTLRTAEFDAAGNLSAEAELDHRICDCCQTDAAWVKEGPVVVYRDRSEYEIRDIAIVRKVNGKWTKPHTIFADNWEIAGCPVNGPTIDALDNQLVVAWFTAANAQPTVKVAFSMDAGATFESPIIIADKMPLGRVDVVLLEKNKAMVSWLEGDENMAGIYCSEVYADGTTKPPFLISKTSAERKSGFPIMKKMGDEMLFAWTKVDSLTSVQTGLLRLR